MSLGVGRESDKSFYHVDFLFTSWGIERAHMTDDLIGVDQNILDWLLRCVGEVKMAVRYHGH